MLIEFRFSNYRSFRDEATLSLEATGLGLYKDSLLRFQSTRLLPALAISGKNGGGKSNVIRALWLAVQFVRSAQRTQHESAKIPVRPFLLNDYSREEPTSFDFIYTCGSTKYWYGFAATREKIVSEYLYHAPKGQKALIFHREGQKFTFTKDKSRRELMREAVGENQLFFSVACTMNDADCIAAMAWFREGVAFTQDYPELASLVMENFQDKSMLKSIADYAKEADVGIADMRFELKDQELPSDEPLPAEMPEKLRAALTQFMQALSDASGNAEPRLRMGQLNVTSEHQGINRGGEPQRYWLGLSDESDGTRRLMRLAPAMEAALQRGGLVVVDEIEENLHPLLLELLISKFQSKEVNKTGAQLVFSTHSSEVFDLLRKDQLYLVDKDPASGASELYSISEFDTRTTDNIRKGYLLGKYGAIPNIELPEVT